MTQTEKSTSKGIYALLSYIFDEISFEEAMNIIKNDEK